MGDDDVLRALRTGDEDAFATVYRDVQPRLLRYLATMVGADDAEEVAGEAWAQAFRDLAKFKGTLDGFRGWLTTIARNRALDLLRSQARRPFADVDPIAHAGTVSSAEADALDTGFRAAGKRHVRFAAADQSCRIADRLHAGGARCHRRAERTLVSVFDRDLTGGEVDEERGDRERRQAANAARIRKTHGVRDRGETADAGADHCRGALSRSVVLRYPPGLIDRFFGRQQGEQDEAFHLLLVLARGGAIGIETGFRILRNIGHDTGDLVREVPNHIVGEGTQA